jgi:hypothetical protein
VIVPIVFAGILLAAPAAQACDGYAAGQTITCTNALEISQDPAARITGTIRTIAANTTLTGQAKTRRVVITLHH